MHCAVEMCDKNSQLTVTKRFSNTLPPTSTVTVTLHSRLREVRDIEIITSDSATTT